MIGRPCACGRIHAATEVVAVGRFLPGGPVGYRARHDSRVRPTRNDARRDVCPEWAAMHQCGDDTCTEEHG